MSVELGEKAQLVYNVQDLNRSIAFYKQLGFHLLDSPDEKKDWALLSDEAILLLLNEHSERFTGISYMSPDMPQRAAALEQEGIQFDQTQSSDRGLVQATCFDPNHIGISLIRFNPSGMPDLDLNKDTRCGIFGEFFIPTEDYESSVNFWQSIGYKALFTSRDPYPHGIFSDGRMIIGLHQRSDFNTPALSYFAPDMSRRIKSLRLEGLEFAREYPDDDGKVRNAVLSSPDDDYIFLFEGDFSQE